MPRTIDYSIRPNYVEYEGQFYHIPEFLSLQEGKVYRPATSRLARWMESARNDFYEQVERLFAPQRVETGTYLSDIVALWLPSEGLHVGLVIRIVRSPSLKSNFPVFEWRSDSQKSEKVTICFRVLNFLKEDSVAWKLQTTNNFRWCHVRSVFKSGRKSKYNTTSMASQCELERCFKGFATFAADGQRKREERRDRKKRRKEKDEGRQPRMYDFSIVERGARRNGRTLQQKLEKNTTDTKG